MEGAHQQVHYAHSAQQRDMESTGQSISDGPPLRIPDSSAIIAKAGAAASCIQPAALAAGLARLSLLRFIGKQHHWTCVLSLSLAGERRKHILRYDIGRSAQPCRPHGICRGPAASQPWSGKVNSRYDPWV
jgi:hypothetical protein